MISSQQKHTSLFRYFKLQHRFILWPRNQASENHKLNCNSINCQLLSKTVRCSRCFQCKFLLWTFSFAFAESACSTTADDLTIFMQKMNGTPTTFDLHFVTISFMETSNCSITSCHSGHKTLVLMQ